MLTTIDKFLAAGVGAALLYANQKWGIPFSNDTATVTAINGVIEAVLVWLVPNLKA